MLMDKKTESPVQRSICALGSVFFWYLFAHGYRFSNNMFSHDSLLGIHQQDSAWEIALGRFMHPILIFLRGGLSNPWLISACSLIFLAIGVCLAVHMLDMKSPVSVVLVSGVLVCNPVLISLNASFLQWVDFYVLALLLSILGIWLCRRGTVPGFALGVIALMVSMGIYQAYICVSIVLVMILLLREAQENRQLKSVVKKALYYCAALLLAAVLYYAVWQLFMRIFDIWAADTYNGMSSLGDYSGVSLLGMIALTYQKVFYYFWHPTTFTTLIFRGENLSVLWTYVLRFANILTVVSLVYSIVVINARRKTKLWQRLFQGVLLLLLPAGMNFVCVLTKGMTHPLMEYAFLFLYVLAADMREVRGCGEKRAACGQVLLWLILLCVVWTNLVFANQVYLKKELQERAITSFMTRIVADIEATEGYIPGVTPVAFSGSFENSPYLQPLAGFDDVFPYGMGKTALTYLGTDYSFIQYELSISINLTRVWAEEPGGGVREMPTYPNKGSIDYVDGVLVVKISE